MTSQTFRYSNATASDVRVVVEPWAEQFLIRPGQHVEIMVRSERTGGTIELEQGAASLVIYGYEGCVISLSSGGNPLVPAPQE